MILHTSTVAMSNTSFTRSHTLTQSLPAGHLSHMNAECTDVCNCAWHHSAICLCAVSATLEDCSFQHVDAGALAIEEDTLLTLKQAQFVIEANNTPT